MRNENERPNPLEEFGAAVRLAVEEELHKAENEAAGRQGMNTPARKIRSFDGSPLFGDDQKNLFPDPEE